MEVHLAKVLSVDRQEMALVEAERQRWCEVFTSIGGNNSVLNGAKPAFKGVQRHINQTRQ